MDRGKQEQEWDDMDGALYSTSKVLCFRSFDGCMMDRRDVTVAA